MDNEIERAFSLAGRTAVVTGAASGIGRQAALTFAHAGAAVVLADVDERGLAAVAAEIGTTATIVVTDVAERSQIEQLATRALAIAGRLDVWANVAAVTAPPTPVIDVDEAMLDRLLAINLKGSYWGAAAAARAMIPRRSGSIINLSSAGADIPASGLSVYALTKAAVNMLTRTLAYEVGPYGVRVNAVAPGFIDTPMVSYRFTAADGTIDNARRDALFAERAAQAALGTIGQPIDVAMAMLYLAGDASRFVTGQTLRPNGGTAMA